MATLKRKNNGVWEEVEGLHVSERRQWNLMGPSASVAVPTFVQLLRVPAATVVSTASIVKWNPQSSEHPFAEFYTTGNEELDNATMSPARVHNRTFQLQADQFRNAEVVPSGYEFTGRFMLIYRLQWDVTSGQPVGGSSGPSGQQDVAPTPRGVIAFNASRSVWQGIFTTPTNLRRGDIIEVQYKEYSGTAPTATRPGGGWIPWNRGNFSVVAPTNTWSVDLPTPSATATGIAVRSRVTRAVLSPTIDSIEATRFSGNRLRRQATISVRTSNAQEVRIRVSNPVTVPSWRIGDDRRAWSPWTTVPVGGLNQFSMPVFYTGTGSELRVDVEARRGTTVVSSSMDFHSRNVGINRLFPPSISWPRSPSFTDPDALSPIATIALIGIATVLTGGIALWSSIATIHVAAGAVSSMTLFTTTSGGLAFLGISTSVGSIGIAATTSGLVAAFGVAGVAGVGASLLVAVSGSSQRNLTVSPRIGGDFTRSRARIGWRIPGFSDTYSSWSSWRTSANPSFSWNNVVGGVGGLVWEVEAQGPDGATQSTVGVRFETDALLVDQPTRVRGADTVTFRGYGMTALRWRTRVDRTDTPGVLGRWSPWINISSRSGRVGTVTGVRTVSNRIEYQTRAGTRTGQVQEGLVSIVSGQAEENSPPPTEQEHIPAPPPPPPPPALPQVSGEQQSVSAWAYITRAYTDRDRPTTPTAPTAPTVPVAPPPTTPTRPSPTLPLPPTTPPPPPDDRTVVGPTNLRVRFTLNTARTRLTIAPTAMNAGNGFRMRIEWDGGQFSLPTPRNRGGLFRFQTGSFTVDVPDGAEEARVEIYAEHTTLALLGPAYFDYTLPAPPPSNLRASFAQANNQITVTVTGDDYHQGRGRARFNGGAWSTPSPTDSGGNRRHRSGTFVYGIPTGATTMDFELYAVNEDGLEVGPAVFPYTIPATAPTTPTTPVAPTAPPPEVIPPTEPEPVAPTTPAPTAPITPVDPGGGEVGPAPTVPEPGPEEVDEPVVLIANQPSLEMIMASQRFSLGAVNPDNWNIYFGNVGRVSPPTTIRFICGGRTAGDEHQDYNDVTMWPSPDLSSASAEWVSVYVALLYEDIS